MAIDLSFLLSKLQEAPAGFGFSDVGHWLQDVPQIEMLAEIAPIFLKDLSKKQWLALVTLIKQKYLKEGPAYNLFDDHLAEYVKHNELADFYKALYLYGDVSSILDFTPLKKQLTKLVVSNCHQVTRIALPASKRLETLALAYLAKLTELVAIEKLKGLRYLAINSCHQLTDFNFIKQLKQLVWLDLSDNEQLTSLNFLMPSHQIVMLQLLNTTLLDDPKNIKRLVSLKHLRYLTVSGKQSQVARLRELLPCCVVNGMTAIVNVTPLLTR